MQVSISDYLLSRLKELSIQHVFGVPGDYNLLFLDQIILDKDLEWIGTCNELNGAYAADGYARVKGAAAMVTTFGVGELSAINGIAGAYAELVPIVHIVGVPATSVIENKSLVHHSLGDQRFSVFLDMYKQITVMQTLVSKENAGREIDKTLIECWRKKRPVYIALPSDLVLYQIDAPQERLNLTFPNSNPDAVAECVDRIACLIMQAKSPVILADLCADRYAMKDLMEDLLAKTNIPFANMNMAKGLIDESHPQYLGNYCGDFSTPGVQEKVDGSDCVITFGAMLSDLNTGGFSAKLNVNTSIEIHSYYTRIKQSVYHDLIFRDVIAALIKRLNNYKYNGSINRSRHSYFAATDKKLTQEYFWNRMPDCLANETILLAEAGTSLFGTLQMPIPDGTKFISQTLWGSIGYTLGALLGVKVAAPLRQTILFIGDGSFQLSAQEVSTMMRYHLNPIIFLINNDGYTVERLIHGEDMPYNDIAIWNYLEFPKCFAGMVKTIRVETQLGLEEVIQYIKSREANKNELVFVEVMLPKLDAPEMLISFINTMNNKSKESAWVSQLG